MHKDVATVVTQVLVSEDDPAFQKPTKPVGAFYDKETAERIAKEKGYTMVEDAGRGYRQVVPSPKPIDVIEKNTVQALVNAGTASSPSAAAASPSSARTESSTAHLPSSTRTLPLRSLPSCSTRICSSS